MTDKSLKSKAINIKGKDYVLVSDRVLFFNEHYQDGAVTTELLTNPESDQIVIKATVFPEAGNQARKFTGYSQAVKGDGMINKTAALENAETSAVGRALAMMGIGVIESIASLDEINKAQGSTGAREIKPRYASMKQVELMVNKVKWGLKTYDKDDIVNFLFQVLGKDLNKIRADEVDEALAKIDEALRENKVADKMEATVETGQPDTIVTDIPDDINLDNTPY